VITNLKNYSSNFDYQSYPLKKEEAEDIDAILTKDIDSYETAAANFRKQISQGMERVNRMQAQVEEMDNQLRNNFINV
jgi:hypothetical protein